MPKQNYASEIGIDSGDKRISWPMAAVILAVLAVGAWFAFSRAATAGPDRPAVPAEEVNTAAPATH